MITVSARAETMLIRQLVKNCRGDFFYSFGKFYNVKLGQNEKNFLKKFQKNDKNIEIFALCSSGLHLFVKLTRYVRGKSIPPNRMSIVSALADTVIMVI